LPPKIFQMKLFLRLIPFSIFLIFHAIAMAQANYTYADLNPGAVGMAFSTDKQWLAVRVGYYDIDIFNLKTRKQEMRFHGGNDFHWNAKVEPKYATAYRAYCSFSPDNRYLLAQGVDDNDRKAGQYLLDLKTQEKYRLTDANTKDYMGFCDATTIWYLNRSTNTLGTARIATATGQTEASTTPLWSFNIPALGKSGSAGIKVEFIIWDTQLKRFLIITREPGEVARPIGTIKPGDTALTPMPKEVGKATKKFAAISATSNAVMFKNWNPEEYVMMDLHNFVCTKGDPFLWDSESSVGDFDTNEQWRRSDDGPNNINSRFTCESLKGGNSQNKEFKVENGGHSYLVSDDLSLMVTSISPEKNLQTLRIFNLKDLKAAPQDLIAPLSKEDEAFLKFVEANKDKFDHFAQQELQKTYLSDGWELASKDKPFMPLDKGMSVDVEPGYQYLLFRIGMDYMFHQQGGEFPNEEHPLTLTLGGNPSDDYYYDTKNYTESYLGYTSEKFFHSGNAMVGNFSLLPDLKERLLRLLPPDGMRVYLLRKKTSWYDSGSHDFDQHRQAQKKVISSSSSSSDPCESGNTSSFDLELMKALEAKFEKYKTVETVVSEVGIGVNTKSFHAPNHDGMVTIGVFTTSLCNEVIVYNITANTFEAARTSVGNSDSAFAKDLSAAGIYVGMITIDNKPNTGTKYQVSVRRKTEGRETEGASLIWVYYEK